MIMYEFYMKFKMFRCDVMHNYPLALVFKLILDQGSPDSSHRTHHSHLMESMQRTRLL